MDEGKFSMRKNINNGFKKMKNSESIPPEVSFYFPNMK